MISYEMLLERYKRLLEKNNLKSTRQREAILHYLYNNDGHHTPEELYSKLNKENPTISQATIYRTLSFLEQEGIVSSIIIDETAKRYEIGTKSHHDHLICTNCGIIVEFFDQSLENLQDQIAANHNFAMQDHTMKIFGLCQKCQTTKGEPS